MDLRTKRVYAPADDGDGRRILVDRLWPRGLPRAALAGVPWVKSVAPSDALRAWFGHEPGKWDGFRRRYFAELDANPDAVAELRGHLGRGRNTLLFGARDEAHNNAVALREYLLRG
jgi:uncharacterized protein YeaO (DUF488 family)